MSSLEPCPLADLREDHELLCEAHNALRNQLGALVRDLARLREDMVVHQADEAESILALELRQQLQEAALDGLRAAVNGLQQAAAVTVSVQTQTESPSVWLGPEGPVADADVAVASP